MILALTSAADRDPVDWISTVLLWALTVAVIVLALVSIRLALVGTRALEKSAHRVPPRQPLNVSVSAMSAGASGTRNASPVPPENPHSPPTPAIGTPRVRV